MAKGSELAMIDFLEYNDTVWVLHTYSNKSNKIEPGDEFLLGCPLCNGLSLRYNSPSDAVLLFNCYDFSEINGTINNTITKITSKVESITEAGGWLQVQTATEMYIFEQLDTTFDDLFNSEEDSNYEEFS